MIEYENMFKDCKTIEFLNMNDIYQFLKSSEKLPSFDIYKERASDFNGGFDLKGAMTQLITGYDKYTQKIIDGLKNISEEETECFGLNMDVCGSSYEMGSVVEGVPECCISDYAPSSKKCLKIVLSNVFSSSIDAKYILNRGIAITNLICSLIAQGYVLDLKYCFYYKPNSYKTSSMFFMNIPTDNLCLATVAFLMTPQFMRLIGIAVSDVNLGKDICGYAKSIKDNEIINYLKDNSVYFLDGYDENIYDNCTMKLKYGDVEKATKTVSEYFNNYKIKKKNND